MARQDVGQGLEALGDDEVRSQVTAGDFSGLPDLDLTDEERELLVGAAEDYPEVAGFALNAYLKLKGQKQGALPSGPAKLDAGFGQFDIAVNYALGGPDTSPGF